MTLLASPTAEDGSLKIHRDVRIYRGLFSANENLNYELAADRHLWLQIVTGDLSVNSTELNKGDGIGLSNIEKVVFTFHSDTEFLLFDLD